MSGRDVSPQVADERLERALSLVLVAGVVISALLIAAGFLASFVVGWTASLVGAQASDQATTDFSGLLARLTDLQPLAITQLGLLALVATPVIRVAASVLAFAAQHDRLYVAVSAIVLVLLLLSLVVLR
jgi:uncharacterized membrane protein